MEEAIFSHVELFAKPKLGAAGTLRQASNNQQEVTVVHNVHAIVGQTEPIYVLGILTQREDTHYYLEDATFSIRLAFTDLQYADPDSFVTENMVLLCKGRYRGDMFYVVSVEQPPLYSLRAREINFKVNQNDYFGAYQKLRRELAAQSVAASECTRAFEQSNVQQEQQSVIVLSEVHLDCPRQMRALEQLFETLEGMLPSIIVVAGRFISEQNRYRVSHEQARDYFEQLGNIIRERSFDYLRDHTEWVFVPALDDPGQINLIPQLPLNQTLVTGFIGTLQGKIKKVTLGTNPLRVSFNGKEVVLSRFNLFQKLKQNHHSRVAFAQEKAKVQENARNQRESTGGLQAAPPTITDDTYRVARTVLHQSFLMPLPQIVQPVTWAYAMDTLALTPHPDFLVLADECSDYHYTFDLGDEFSSHPVAGRDDIEMRPDGDMP